MRKQTSNTELRNNNYTQVRVEKRPISTVLGCILIYRNWAITRQRLTRKLYFWKLRKPNSRMIPEVASNVRLTQFSKAKRLF